MSKNSKTTTSLAVDFKHWTDSFLLVWDQFYACDDPAADLAVFAQRQLLHPFFRLDLILEFDLQHVMEMAIQPPLEPTDKPFKKFCKNRPGDNLVKSLRQHGGQSYQGFQKAKSEFDKHYYWLFSLTARNRQWDAFESEILPKCKHLLDLVSESPFDGDERRSFFTECLPLFYAATLRVSEQAKCLPKMKTAWEPFIEALVETAFKLPAQNSGSQVQDVFIDFASNIFGFLVLSGHHFGLRPALENLDRFILIRKRIGSRNWRELDPNTRDKHVSVALFCLGTLFPYGKPIDGQGLIKYESLYFLRQSLLEQCAVLDKSNGSAHTTVLRYFVGGIDEALSLEKAHFGRLENYDERDQFVIHGLVERFRLYRYPVTIEKLVNFLSQFGTRQNIKFVLTILRHVKFFTLGNLQAMLEQAFLKFKDHKHCKVFCPLGDRGGSAALMSYLASHWTLSEVDVVSDIGAAINRTRRDEPICLYDDGVYSGTQLLNIFEDLLGTRELRDSHTKYCDALDDPKAFLRKPIRLCFAIVCTKGLKKLNRRLKKMGFTNFEIRYSLLENMEAKPFDASMSNIWETNEDMERAKELFWNIGYSILEKRGYSENRRRKSSLGFGNDQRLIIYQYNVSKSTLTPLWESGEYDGKPWTPLFPLDGYFQNSLGF